MPPQPPRLSARERERGEDEHLVNLRRFCIDCGVRAGLHAPGDLLYTRSGQRLWLCRCRVVWELPACLKCPRCLGDCPLRPK